MTIRHLDTTMNRLSLRLHLARCLLLPAALALPVFAGAADTTPAPSLKVAAKTAFWWGDFATIDRWNTEYSQPGRFDADGASRLDLFRGGLAGVFNTDLKNPEPFMKELDLLTLQWAQEHPRSPFAHVLHARSLLAHGESYRGGGFANDVPPEAWEFYRSYLNQAATYLREHAEVALADSYAHYVLIKIGRGLGWKREQLATIALEGTKRNPDDINLHEAMVDALLPKWGGNAKALDAYILQATEAMHAARGWGMYAHLYAEAQQGQYGNALFEDSHADWDKMKQGFEDILAKYPASAAQRNRYAYMACIAKDKPVLLRLLGEIGKEADTAQWGKNPDRAIETCRRWATQT